MCFRVFYSYGAVLWKFEWKTYSAQTPRSEILKLLTRVSGNVIKKHRKRILKKTRAPGFFFPFDMALVYKREMC